AKNLPVDSGKLASCGSKFTATSQKADTGSDCGAASGDTAAIETKVDAFVNDVNSELATAGPTKLAFTVVVGTTNCGAAGLTSPPAAPTSGHLDSDTGCTTSVSTLGLGCLYFGGGNATIVPPGAIPDGSTSILGISGTTLSGSNTGNPDTCTVGDGPGKHCINGHCATNADCGAGTCTTG